MTVVTQLTDSLIDYLHDSAVCCLKLSVVINSILISKNVFLCMYLKSNIGGSGGFPVAKTLIYLL